MPTETKTRILLADDHPRLLAETARLVGQTYEVIGMVADGLELIDAAQRLDPDLIVLDISMPGLDGFEAARRLKQSGCRSKILFLTVWDDCDFLHEAMDLGASGYLVKSRMCYDLMPAIAAVLGGRTYISLGSVRATQEPGRAELPLSLAVQQRRPTDCMAPMRDSGIVEATQEAEGRPRLDPAEEAKNPPSQ